jgi:hypothetical protein
VGLDSPGVRELIYLGQGQLLDARFILVEQQLVPHHLSDYCLLATAEIITASQGISVEKLLQGNLTDKDVNEDLFRSFSTRRDLERFVAAKDFSLGLFLEVLYYVVSVADFLFQLRRDKDAYFEVRKRVQPCLYDALGELFALGQEQMSEVEDTLVNRAEDYCEDLATSGDRLLFHISDWGTAEWRLILSETAYYFMMAVAAQAFGQTLINCADVKGDFEVNCVTCSETLSGMVRGSSFSVTCGKCKTSFEIVGVVAARLRIEATSFFLHQASKTL